MKDFPLFTTDYGVSSLILREVPYRAEAYIYVQDVQPGELENHLKECVSFCRMVGAERILATGSEELACYPYAMSLIQMRGAAQVDHSKLCSLFPVTQETVSRWRGIYNERMRGVDTAQTLESRDEKQILSSQSYFVHENGTLLGIGWLEDNKILAVAAVIPGAGEKVMYTLMSLAGEEMIVEVASTNHKAIRLYEKMGFVKAKELYRWYIVG